MSLARDRYIHLYKQWPLWGDDREWLEWREKSHRLWLEQAHDPETVAELEALVASQQKKTDHDYVRIVADIKLMQENAGKPGFNEHGVPLHACAGHKHDQHVAVWYWQVVVCGVSGSSPQTT